MTAEVSLLWNHYNDFTLGPELNFFVQGGGILDGIIQEYLKICNTHIL